MAGTGGSASGANGEGLPWRQFLILFGVLTVFLTVVAAVNVSSVLIEDPPGQRSFHIWEPVLWEGSSLVAILCLLPLIWIGYWQFHWRGQPLWRSLAFHAAFGLLFSLTHIAIMVAIRMVGYGMAGAHYDFAQGDLALQMVYEMRKDAISYAILYAAIWGQDRLVTRPPTASAPARLEVKADGRTLYIDPSEIMLVEAAGNYVDLVRCDVAKPLLVRGTLSQFETQLTPHGFVRVHRSRLVNRGRIAGFEGTPSGDVRIRMSDGREIVGSRRYRENLEGKA